MSPDWRRRFQARAPIALAALLSLALRLPAEDHWTGVKSGQFEVLTDGGDKSAREKLMFLEQFREALRVITGKDEIRMVWPIRVLVFKNAKLAPAIAPHFALGRDARMDWVTESGDFSAASRKGLARVLLSENLTPLPPPVEEGIIELLSTLEVTGTRITVGAPVPEPERSYGWALMQLVTVNPDYSGRSRVMVSNLEQSGDFEAACRNAFQKSEAEMRQQVEAYRKSGNFPTGAISGRALSPVRDFKPLALDPDDGKIAQGDLLLAGAATQAESAYLALHGARASEGLGLIAVKNRKDAEAQRLFRSAVESGSESARAWLELGKVEGSPAKSQADFKRASELNPRWGAPYFQLASAEDVTERKAALLKKAATLEPRNIDYWQALARTETSAKNFQEAQKAWAGAEHAATTDEERTRIHQVRLDVEEERADYTASELKRIREERAEDIARVKAESEAAIHAAEAEANKKLNPSGAAQPQSPVWMDDLKGNASVEGVFTRLECLGQQARMNVRTADGKIVLLLIRDPNQIVIAGGAEKTFGCGAQNGSPKVKVEYQGKADAKLRTIGDVTTIEFR